MVTLKEIKAKYPLGGRPVSFKTPEDFRKKLWDFLLDCENSKTPITVEAFCAFAGVTKQTFYTYRNKKGFKEVVEQFRQIVEKYFVEQLIEGKPGNKADFVLKNAFGDEWKEKSTVAVDGVEGIVLKVLDHDSGNEHSTNIQTPNHSTEEV